LFLQDLFQKKIAFKNKTNKTKYGNNKKNLSLKERGKKPLKRNKLKKKKKIRWKMG